MKLIKKAFQTDAQGVYDITREIVNSLHESQIRDGICVIYTPHTTCAITINENADPAVQNDLLFGLTVVSPYRKEYEHDEGNSDAHLKSSLIGCSETIIVENGKLVLGTWQGIYFMEFDGPRYRNYYIKFIEG